MRCSPDSGAGDIRRVIAPAGKPQPGVCEKFHNRRRYWTLRTGYLLLPAPPRCRRRPDFPTGDGKLTAGAGQNAAQGPRPGARNPHLHQLPGQIRRRADAVSIILGRLEID